MTRRRLFTVSTFTVGLALITPSSMAQQSPTGQPTAPQQISAHPGPPGVAPQPAAPPFQLSKEEQQFVLQTLEMWEGASAQVNTFTADFEKLTYDGVFGLGPNTPMMLSTGSLSFSKPDKGSFKEDKISRWTKDDRQNVVADAPGKWVEQPDEVGDHWVCDGKAVYEYNHREKQLVVTRIPDEMRGASIVDGPLPFLFGADANKLVQRYWIRSKQSGPAEIWLEAYPRWQADAANYDFVDVMLDRKTMQPKAIQVHLPGGQQRHVYMFKNLKVNESNLGTWFTGLFSAPRTPPFWTRVMAEDVAPQAANPQGPVKR